MKQKETQTAPHEEGWELLEEQNQIPGNWENFVGEGRELDKEKERVAIGCIHVR